MSAMSQARLFRLTLALATFAVIVVAEGSARSQAKMDPVNDRPNPYETIEDFLQVPAAREWGAMPAMELDPDGTSIWVTERCGANTCAGSDLPVVHKIDASGNVVKSFGGGILNWPHGIHIDPDGNIWVTDARAATPEELEKFPDAKGKGHAAYKFSPDGELLMTLGTPGVAGDPPEYLNEPCDVTVAPNGDILVAEGHSGQSANPRPDTVSRISRFTKDGEFIKVIGKRGTGPGEFKTPHALLWDSRGRLLVADRGNNRIQFLDQDGNYLAAWYQFSRPSGLFIDANDMLYVADGESGPESPHGDWHRGIRIGSLEDGKVIALIPEPVSHPEGVAVDKDGNIYGGEVARQVLKKFVRK